MDMKLPMYLGNELITAYANFGQKNGYSPYLVSKTHSPSELKDLIGFFNASDLAKAIQYTVKYYLNESVVEVYLLTGDGQLIRITKGTEKAE